MLLEKLEEARIAESEQINPLRVIDKAQLPIDPISPRKKLNLVIGFLLGLIVGVAISFVIELKNDSIKSTSEVERLTQWPILAMIPNINTFSKGKFRKTNFAATDKNTENERSYRALFSSLEPNTPIAEAYRMLRTNLQFTGLGREYKTLLVTSLGPGDGKTTTITNLAITFATFGDRTLIMDADLRIPVMHSFFGLERESGVTDLLEALGELDSMMANPRSKESVVSKVFHQEMEEKLNVNLSTLKDNNHPEGDSDDSEEETDSTESIETAEAGESSENNHKYNDVRGLFDRAIKSTGIQNLSFLTSGRKLQDPEGLISTRPMPLILQRFKNRFNTILVDSAPLLLVNDTLMLAGIVEAVILVVDANNCSKEMLLKAKKQLSNSKANVVGIVLNNFEVEGSYKTYYSNYYSEKV
jgi:Mrp family chromosome partitioning ATPase